MDEARQLPAGVRQLLFEGIAFGDVQFYPHNEYSKPTPDGYTTLLREQEQSFRWALEVIHQSKPAFVVYLGDWNQTFGYVDTMSLMVSYRMGQELKRVCEENGIDLHFLLGNHDIFNNNLKVHSVPYMEGVLCEDIEVKKITRRLGSVNALFVPYTDDYDKVRYHLASGGFNLTFTHLDIIGSVRMPGSLQMEGLDPDEFPTYTFNGHFHHPSIVHGRFPNQIYNVGALNSRSYHDANGAMRRGLTRISYYSDGSVETKRIENPYDSIYWKAKVENAGELQILKALPDKERTNIRVYYSRAIQHEVKELQDKGGFGHFDPIPLSAEKMPERSSLKVDLSPEENLKLWVVNSETELNRELLLSFGMDVLKQALARYVERVSARNAVTFLQTKIENYLSFGVAEVPLHNQGLVLIEGDNRTDAGMVSNGSGKSTIFDAFYWCLTGKSMRGLVGDAVINEKAKYCIVSVEFMVGEDFYQVLRSRNHPTYGTSLKLYCNGDDISPRLGAGVEEHLQRLIGMSGDVMRQVAILTKSLAICFSMLGEAERSNLIMNFAGAMVYEDCRELTRDIVHTMQTQLSGFVSKLAKIEEDTAAGLEDMVRLEQEKGKVKERYDAQVADNQAQIERQQAKMAELAKQLVALEKVIADSEQEYSSCMDKFGQADSYMVELNNKHMELVGSFRISMDVVQKLNQLMQTGTCPMCHHDLDPAQLEKELQEHQAKTEQVQFDKRQLEERIDQLQLRKGQLLNRQRELSRLMTDTRRQKGILDQQMQGVNDVLAHLRVAIVPLSTELANIDGRIQALAESIANRYDEQSEIQAQKELMEKNLEVAKWWYDPATRSGAFSSKGIPSFVLDRSIEVINSSTIEYSRLIWGDKVVKLTNQVQLKSGETRNRIGIDISGGRAQKKQSSGENNRTDLIIQFGLNDLAESSANNVNILICDEVDAFLDEEGLRGLVDILTKKAETKSVFLVTQNPALKTLVPKRWTVIKENDISRLEYGR